MLKDLLLCNISSTASPILHMHRIQELKTNANTKQSNVPSLEPKLSISDSEISRVLLGSPAKGQTAFMFTPKWSAPL